jgi:hypothetical protein
LRGATSFSVAVKGEEACADASLRSLLFPVVLAMPTAAIEQKVLTRSRSEEALE